MSKNNEKDSAKINDVTYISLEHVFFESRPFVNDIVSIDNHQGCRLGLIQNDLPIGILSFAFPGFGRFLEFLVIPGSSIFRPLSIFFCLPKGCRTTITTFPQGLVDFAILNLTSNRNGNIIGDPLGSRC